MTSARIAGGLALFLILASAQAKEAVTVLNYIRAETDLTFNRTANELGTFKHQREAVGPGFSPIIRPNRDTLYSHAVFDLTKPVRITKPTSSSRYQSLAVINQNHYIPLVTTDGGSAVINFDKVGTRYAMVLVRTFVDPNDPEDVIAAHAFQDELKAEQADTGKLEIPDWDEDATLDIRYQLGDLSKGVELTSAFGAEDEVDPIQHLLGTASGWGGLPRSEAIYFSNTVDNNNGFKPYTLNIPGDVPCKAFWSVSVYNRFGFFKENDLDAYSFNSVTALKNRDGSAIIRFGGRAGLPNYLPITPGWTYLFRCYQPTTAVQEGTWTPPAAQPLT